MNSGEEEKRVKGQKKKKRVKERLRKDLCIEEKGELRRREGKMKEEREARG